MRIIALVGLLSSSLAVAQQHPQVRFGPPVISTPDVAATEATVLRRVLVRRRGQVRRCLQRDTELVGTGTLNARVALSERGRVTAVQILDAEGNAAAGLFPQCLVAVLRRLVFPEGLTTRAMTVPLAYIVPEPSVDVDAALAEQRAARTRGRCLIEAANELRAAARAVRNRTGRARRRAITRFEAAHVALRACDGMGVGTGIGNLQQLQQTQPNPFRIDPGSCPGCYDGLQPQCGRPGQPGCGGS